MSISDTYLEKSKQKMDEYPWTKATDSEIEHWATEIAQQVNLEYRDIVPLLRERSGWLTDVSVWPEVEAQYFTVYWVVQHLLKDYLEEELEAYGKSKQQLDLSKYNWHNNREGIHERT